MILGNYKKDYGFFVFSEFCELYTGNKSNTLYIYTCIIVD